MDAQSQIIVSLIVGYLVAWGRSLKNLPDPVIYLLAAVIGAVVYWLAIPDGSVIQWKQTAWQYVAFLLSARGVAGASVEARVAPKQNSL